jgi:integrase
VSILKVGPQHYRVFLHLGRDADGRQLRRSETVKGTRAEAERRERELRRALDTGTFVDPGAGTVAELMTRWLESIKDKKSERTYVRYEQMVRNQIVPDLGHIKLAQLRPLHIDAAEAKWATTGNRKTKKRGPLSPQSLLHLHRCLHTAFERAVKWRLLAINPMDGVETPYVPRNEADFLLPDEAVRLLDAIRESEYELPILVGLYGGLRPSEYLALPWRHLSIDSREVRVVQAVHRVRNDRVTRWENVEIAGYRFAPTKTHRSMRPVGLPAELVEMLLVWKPLQAATRLKAGPAWHDLGLIFSDTIGQPLDGQRVRRFFEKALTKAQVGRRRLYALRHTMATLMLLRRESPKLVAARLGHANETLVLRTYGHLIPGQDQEAADRLAQMLRDLQCTRSAQAAIAGLDRYAAAGSQGPPFANTNLAERVGFEPTIGLPL